MKPTILITTALLAAPAHAVIIYVDATEGALGNTRATGFAQSNTDWMIANRASTDNTHWSNESTGTGERRLYGVNLGPVTLSGGTSVDVYIDMLIEGSSSTTRTFYDGVGYELIPEPSTALIGGLGLLCLLRRRR